MQHVLDILEIINKEPNLSQKKIAERSGISTGKVNYIINDLTKKIMLLVKKWKTYKLLCERTGS